MRRILTLMRSEFLLEFSAPGSWVFFLLLPLLFTTAIGAGLSGMMSGSATPEEVRPTVYVTGLPAGELGATLRQVLEDNNLQFQEVTTLPRGQFALALPADMIERVSAGDVVTATLYLDPQSSLVTAVELATRAALSRIGGAVLVAQMGVEQGRAMELFTTPAVEQVFFKRVLDNTLAAVREPPVMPHVVWALAQGESEDLLRGPSGQQQAAAGQLVTWTLITLLGAAEVFVSERIRGTWQRLLIMPTGRLTLLTGKLSGRLMLGLFQMALLMVSGELVFHVGWGRSPLAALGVSLSFALAGVSLGMLLATFLRTRGQASGLVIGLSMALAALGGAWFPLEITPVAFQRVAQLFPSTWAMRAYTLIITRGASLKDVAPSIGVLCAFAVLYFGLAGLRLRRESVAS